jgi:hypothetical protein
LRVNYVLILQLLLLRFTTVLDGLLYLAIHLKFLLLLVAVVVRVRQLALELMAHKAVVGQEDCYLLLLILCRDLLTQQLLEQEAQAVLLAEITTELMGQLLYLADLLLLVVVEVQLGQEAHHRDLQEDQAAAQQQTR